MSSQVVFRWKEKANKVSIKGSWNWDKVTEMQKEGEEYSVSLDLPDGTYQFGFEVDGIWKLRPDLEFMEIEGHKNNLIIVSHKEKIKQDTYEKEREESGLAAAQKEDERLSRKFARTTLVSDKEMEKLLEEEKKRKEQDAKLEKEREATVLKEIEKHESSKQNKPVEEVVPTFIGRTELEKEEIEQARITKIFSSSALVNPIIPDKEVLSPNKQRKQEEIDKVKLAQEREEARFAKLMGQTQVAQNILPVEQHIHVQTTEQKEDKSTSREEARFAKLLSDQFGIQPIFPLSKEKKEEEKGIFGRSSSKQTKDEEARFAKFAGTVPTEEETKKIAQLAKERREREEQQEREKKEKNCITKSRHGKTRSQGGCTKQ